MTKLMKLNGINRKALKETCELIKKQPELAKTEFRASNSWIDGGHNQVIIQNYYAAGQEQRTRHKPFIFDADEPPALLGEDSAANPVEYLLTALSSCMTTSIVYHTAVKGYRIDHLHSEFKGDLDLQGFLGLNPSVPKGYQKIHAIFKVKTDAPKQVIEEAYHFSPVYSMLSKGVPIDIDIKMQ